MGVDRRIDQLVRRYINAKSLIFGVSNYKKKWKKYLNQSFSF